MFCLSNSVFFVKNSQSLKGVATNSCSVMPVVDCDSVSVSLKCNEMEELSSKRTTIKFSLVCETKSITVRFETLKLKVVKLLHFPLKTILK